MKSHTSKNDTKDHGLLLKALCRLIVVAVVTVILVNITTYGWINTDKQKTQRDKVLNETEQRLKNTVYELASNIGNRNYEDYDNLNRSKEYIVRMFENLGYQTKLMNFKIDDQVFSNVIAEPAGLNRSDEVIILGAHYDTCYNPGADDNASGVAGLLEIARMLTNEELKTKIKFIAFVNEEPPFFKTEYMGSRVYTKQAKAEKETIKAAIILESIGYYSDKKRSQRYPPFLGPFFPGTGNFIAMVSNFRSSKVAGRLETYYKESSDLPMVSATLPSIVAGVDFSDHWSFWQERYTAVMITDTAHLRNEHYHQSTDMPDTLDYKKMAQLVKGIKSALIKFSNE